MLPTLDGNGDVFGCNLAGVTAGCCNFRSLFFHLYVMFARDAERNFVLMLMLILRFAVWGALDASGAAMMPLSLNAACSMANSIMMIINYNECEIYIDI